MKDFAKHLQEDQRLVILRILAEMSSYRANSSVLCTALDQFGHSISRDKVKTEIQWLSEQGLVYCEDISDVLIATLSERGADVAAGRITVPGVKRPRA